MSSSIDSTILDQHPLIKVGECNMRLIRREREGPGSKGMHWSLFMRVVKLTIHSTWRSWFVFFQPFFLSWGIIFGGESWRRTLLRPQRTFTQGSGSFAYILNLNLSLTCEVTDNMCYLKEKQPFCSSNTPNEPLILPSMQHNDFKMTYYPFINEQCDPCNIIFLFYIYLMSMLSRQISYHFGNYKQC